jgi:pyruvate dehydrogenase E2 component (dihydrolipoamide acetyltransferase)
MASDVTMPRLSDSMEEGTVLKWLVDEGGEVKRGEPLVEIETDKANMTYDADTDGVLVEIVAQEGDTLEIGEVIARIGDAGEAKSGGGDEAEEGDEEEAGGGEEEAAAEEGEGGEDEAAEDEAAEDEDAGGEESGDEDEAGDADEAGDEEKEGAVAEGEGDEAEGGGEEEEAGDEEAEGDEEGEAAAAEGGDDGAADEGEDEDEDAAAEGEEAAVAGAEGGGGETQAGAGTATREKTSTGNGDGRVKASPVARRMARDLGVELAELEGTGPGGRIVKADVQAAAENGGGKAGVAEKGRAEPADGDGADADAGAKDDAEAAKKDKKGKKKDRKADDKAEKKDGEKEKEAEKAEAGVKGHVKVEELTRLQQTVSRRMAESKATAPDFSIALSVDMTAAVALRERLKEISDPVPSFNDMVVKACAGALREHPRVNGSYRDGKFELYDRVNIGIAVAAMDALVVPTVFDADQKSLGQIARDAREVIGKVKDKTVTPPELSGGTFTVSNLGMFGIEQFTAIINPPQAAILTVGKLEKKPVVDDKGKIVARDQMVLTLVCDHRILYGADGAEFLARVKDLLEQPLSLAL